MKLYKSFRNANMLNIDEKNKTFGLKGSNYHIHVDDLLEGNEPIEINIVNKLLEYLNINKDKINIDSYMKCCEEIFNFYNDIILIKNDIKD